MEKPRRRRPHPIEELLAEDLSLQTGTGEDTVLRREALEIAEEGRTIRSRFAAG